MKKEGLFLLILILLICNFSIISAKNSTITGKIITNNAIENLSSESPLDMQDLYKQASPAVVKILISADYNYYLPLVKDVDFSEYNRKIDYGQEVNFTRDVKVIYDEKQNMYDEWGKEYGEQNYANDFNKGLGYGSGFLISPEGYVLTNSHVAIVNKTFEEEWIKSGILYSTSYYIDETYASGGYPTDYEYAYDIAVYNFMLERLRINISNIRVKVIVGVDNSEKRIYAKEYDPEIVDFEGDASDYAEESLDWALLKIEDKNLPFLYLGNSDEVLIGSSVNVIGYPGVSEEKIYTSESIYAPTDPYVSLRKDVEPSLSKGYISYIRPIVGGYKTFQMDISTTGGNSGGPVLNDKGEVVGIATYGYSEYQGGNYNYAQRINDIKTKIAEKVDLPQKESITSSANLEESSKESASIFIFVIIGLVILSLLAVILTRKFGNKSSGKRSK